MGWCYLLGWFIFGLGIGANAKHSEMEGSFCKSCPDGWTWYGGRCYVFVDTKKTWADAEKYCNSRGGNLVSLRTAIEYLFIRELVHAITGSNTECWVGGYNAVKDKAWFWSDGTFFDFDGWCHSEPDSSGGQDHCMAINRNGKDCASDEKCSECKDFVCAKDCPCPS